MAFEIKKPGVPDAKASRFAAMREAALKAASAATTPPAPPGAESSKTQEMIRAATLPAAGDCPERIRIIFDDSYSMHGQAEKDAREGVVEFLRSCVPGVTSVALDLLNAPKDDTYYVGSSISKLPTLLQKGTLTSDLILLASAVDKIEATGSTPLFQTLLFSLSEEPRATRLIAFTDGQPDSLDKKEEVLAKAQALKIPIDTVYLKSRYEDAEAKNLLKELAERTGGIFLDFSKGSASFKSAFKYLAPVNRLQLMSPSFKASLEGK